MLVCERFRGVVAGERPAEDIQGLGVYGDDGAGAPIVHLAFHGGESGPEVGERCGLVVAHNWPALVHHDLLPRLCDNALREGADGGLQPSLMVQFALVVDRVFLFNASTYIFQIQQIRSVIKVVQVENDKQYVCL